MAINDLRSEELLKGLEGEFGKKVTLETLSEFVAFCYKRLNEKYVESFKQLTDYNGKLERRIEELEKKINAS